MKLNELISSFYIYTNNEERSLLETLDRPRLYDSFEEREKIVINNLTKKSLVAKVVKHGLTWVINNEY